MQVQTFTVPIHGGTEAMADMNAFLAGHRVHTMEKQFVADGDKSAWCFCVTFDHPATRQAIPRAADKADRVDYREVLSTSDFAMYARLRDLRKTLSEQASIPIYNVFTNEQLAKLVQSRATSVTVRALSRGSAKQVCATACQCHASGPEH